MLTPDPCQGCPLLFCDTLSPLCQASPETKLEMHRQELKRQEQRQRHLEQLADARQVQKLKRQGRRVYPLGLGKYNARRQKAASLGFKKYDKRCFK